MSSIGAVCKHAADSLLYAFKGDPVHLVVAYCIRCVMQHCFSLVSSMLRWQLTAVLGDSFVLLPYLCALRNSVTSHPTCSPHPPSLYIKLNRRSTSGDAEVGYICLPTQRWRWGLGRYSDPSVFFYGNVIHDIQKHFIWSRLKITRDVLFQQHVRECI